MKPIVLLLIQFFFLASINAQSVLDQSNIGNNPTRSLVDNIQNFLQTFVPQVTGELAMVKVDLQTEDCPYALICKIYEGSLGSNLLATEIITIPVNTPRTMQTITFTNPPVLTAGNTYTLALYANCVSGPGYSIWWYKSVNDAYDAGQAYNQWGTTIQPEDTLNDFYFQTYMTGSSGFEEMNDSFVAISPNPADQYVHIQFSGTDAIEYELRDATGRVVLAGMCESGATLLTEQLQNGFYFLSLHQGMQVVSKRIIVNHAD